MLAPGTPGLAARVTLFPAVVCGSPFKVLTLTNMFGLSGPFPFVGWTVSLLMLIFCTLFLHKVGRGNYSEAQRSWEEACWDSGPPKSAAGAVMTPRPF